MLTPEQLARSGTEDGEQTALFCWASQNVQRFPSLRWMYAIPNGGGRSIVTAARLRATGVKSGVADICLPVGSTCVAQPANVMYPGHTSFLFSGLYIEMKRANGVPSDVKDDQLEFAAFVSRHSHAWHVAFGWKQATYILLNYLAHEQIQYTAHQFAVYEKVRQRL